MEHRDTVGAVSSVVVTIAGCIYCFTSNGGAAGHAFLPRFMAVLWVVSIRVIVIALVLALPIAGLADWLGFLKDETTWWETILGLVFEVVVYLRTATHLRRIAAYWARLQEVLAPTPSPA